MTAEIRKVAWSQAAFGYRRITATLRRQDWRLKDELVPQAQPYDNGHREIFHRSLREELLNAELFHSLEEARVQGGNRLNWSNGERPFSRSGLSDSWGGVAGGVICGFPWLFLWRILAGDVGLGIRERSRQHC